MKIPKLRITSIYNLKPAFQKLLRPLCRWLAKHHFKPNQITIIAVIISFLTGVAIALFPTDHWPFLLVPIILLIRMILNALDGMLAKEHHMKTPLGIFLNELGDVFSDTFLYLPFSLVPHISHILVVLVVILAIISEMTGVIATQIGVARRYDGPMGKSDRTFIFALMSLILGIGYPANNWFNIVLGIMVLLLMMTIINRVQKALRATKQHA